MTSLPPGYRALVVGAGGGLGQAFMRHLQADPRCAEVRGLGRSTVPALDFEDPASVEVALRDPSMAGPWQLVIVSSGVLHGPGLRPEKRLAELDPTALQRMLAINAVGPALLLRHLTPHLDRGRTLVGVLSAKVGSIEDNRLGGWYAYRASKAALNMLLRTTAIEWARSHRQAVLAALHPGTVDTALSAPFGGAQRGRPAAVAAAEMLAVLDGLGPEDSGGFHAYDGQRLPF